MKDLERVKNEFFKNTKQQNWQNLEIALSFLDYYKNIIDTAIYYCEHSGKTIKSYYFSDLLKILKGDSLEK